VRVALDDSLRGRRTTGISLYARCLGDALEPRVSLERWSPANGRSASLYTLAELPQRLAEEKPDVFHAVCNFNLPLQRVAETKLVLTVHDLIPLLLPETVSFAYRWQFRLWLARSVRVAHEIICVSQTTRQALLEHFGVDAHVVHHGVDHVDRVPPPDDISLKWIDALGLGKNFVLYAGALDARKNVQHLVDVTARLGCTLALAGQPWFGHRAFRDPHVRALGYLPDPIFYELMRRARVFVFPSRYEGFGLPPLEAMRLGTPTVVANRGALPEICGNGALVVEPEDLGDALRSAIDDERLRTTLIEKGRARAHEFTWRKCADQTLAIYEGGNISPVGKSPPPAHP
jgi:glycosyltransferase involved in cell wall biosynthesis